LALSDNCYNQLNKIRGTKRYRGNRKTL